LELFPFVAGCAFVFSPSVAIGFFLDLCLHFATYALLPGDTACDDRYEVLLNELVRRSFYHTALAFVHFCCREDGLVFATARATEIRIFLAHPSLLHFGRERYILLMNIAFVADH